MATEIVKLGPGPGALPGLPVGPAAAAVLSGNPERRFRRR